MKCPPTSDEATFLNKTFKFFDIQNKGGVNQDQFQRAVEKMGVVLTEEMVCYASISLTTCVYSSRTWTLSSATTTRVAMESLTSKNSRRSSSAEATQNHNRNPLKPQDNTDKCNRRSKASRNEHKKSMKINLYRYSETRLRREEPGESLVYSASSR